MPCREYFDRKGACPGKRLRAQITSMKATKKILSLVLVMTMLLSMVYFAPAAHADVASQYISSEYWSYIQVKTTEEADLRLGPTDYTDCVYTIPAGVVLTVTEMIYNIYGWYWYQINYYGQTLYVWSGYVTPVGQLTDDVEISGHVGPSALAYGDEFYIEGEIISTYNKIQSVTVSMYKGTDITKGATASATEDVGKDFYTLTDSSLANSMPFSSLNPGIYTYVVSATAYSNYYSDSFKSYTRDVIVARQSVIITNYEKYTEPMSVGVDVSEANGVIDWTQAKDDIDFAIIRISDGTTLDPQFHANIQGCIDNGIPYGVYLYSLATTKNEAAAEAQLVLTTLSDSGYTPTYGVWFDMEDYVQTGLTSTLRENVVRSFIDTVSSRGYLAGLFSQLAWYNNFFNDTYYKTVPKWIAQVSDLTEDGTHTYEGGTWLHQYTWTGRVSGISGDVNMNYCYFPVEDIEDTVSFLSQCTYYPSHAEGTAVSPVNIRQYPSTDYAAVSLYAEDEEVYITGLYKTPGGNYWYQVVQGAIRGFAHSSWINTTALLFNDVNLQGLDMADKLSYGETYPISGTITSKASQIAQVKANIYCGEDTGKNTVTSEYQDVYDDEFNLFGSDLVKNLRINSLVNGYYTLEIVAVVTNYGAKDGELYSQTQDVTLALHSFIIQPSEIAPNTCAHNPVHQSAIAATCTSTGITKGSYCSSCGTIISVQVQTPVIPHTYENGTCTACGKVCTHTYQNGICTQCEMACNHNFSNGACTVCGIACEHQYTDGICTVCGYNCAHSYSNGKCYLCGYICSHTYTGGLCTSCGVACKHRFNGTTCIVCQYVCQHNYVDGYCSVCDSWCPHNYVDGYCTDCGAERPDYYLFGFINGANYACEEDAENIGEYLFVNGQLTVNFTENSYVGIKLGDNSIWYMTDGWLGEETTSAILTNTELLGDSANKLFVPGRREVVFTMTTNPDGTISLTYFVSSCAHNWTEGTCTVCGENCTHEWENHTCNICGKTLTTPTFTLKNYSVSFDGEVCYNIYYTVDQMKGIRVENMGLITWSKAQPSGTIETATDIIPGALTDGSQFMVKSKGIAAKTLGDNLYFKIYAQLEDGSYAYSDLKSVNAKNYAIGRINKSTNAHMKALSVAMLNYGAAAQTYFNYQAYNLMNASLTDAQKALVSAYDPSMVDAVVSVSSEKAGSFTKKGFGTCTVTASFEGAFVLNYYLNTTYVPDGDVTLYYWTLDDFNKVSVLTKENATGTMVTLPTDVANQYWGEVTGIAAKELDKTVFVAAVYTSGGVEYTTTVMNYSMGRYCVKLAGDNTSAQQQLAQATAVYGYYAKRYFASLYG